MKRTTLRLVVIVAIMVALLLGLTINSKAASVPFYISNASGEIGQTVAVTIKTTDKIVADDINIDISYDTDKLSITNNDIILSQAIYDTFTVDENFMYGVKEDQKVISIGGYKMSPFTFEADTNLVTLNFTIKEGTLAKEIYEKEEISERHRHRYEFNNDYREKIEKAGMKISGTSPDGLLVEMVELNKKEHPYFIAGQFHPELKSRPNKPAPLFVGLVKACRIGDVS